jgi:hypothetical protein
MSTAAAMPPPVSKTKPNDRPQTTSPPPKKNPDYLFMLLCGAAFLVSVPPLVGYPLPFTAMPLIMMLVYVWSRNYPDAQVGRGFGGSAQRLRQRGGACSMQLLKLARRRLAPPERNADPITLPRCVSASPPVTPLQSQVSLYGLVTIQAFYLPFAFLFITVIMGGSPIADMFGIAAGHLWYFFTDLYPRSSGRWGGGGGWGRAGGSLL